MDIYIFNIIINRFSYQQKFNLIILFKIDKNLKMNFY